jgi:hypothetical protein
MKAKVKVKVKMGEKRLRGRTVKAKVNRGSG